MAEETLRLLMAMPDPGKGRHQHLNVKPLPPGTGCPPTQAEVLLLSERNPRGLRGQQAADVLHSHALMVNLQDVAAMATHKAAQGR